MAHNQINFYYRAKSEPSQYRVDLLNLHWQSSPIRDCRTIVLYIILIIGKAEPASKN